MTYKETLLYLYSQLPMFQRVGAAAYKADLANTIALMDALGHPYRNFKSIHIAGTNGKGSTSHMLAAVLQKAGYKVGLYTSPHLKDFRERIKINGAMIPQKSVVSFVETHRSTFEKIKPSFFEWTVALAFQYFSDKGVDVAIVEVGLGGRLDSTNVIEPELSIITNISNDHAALLGNTIKKIAAEKAGIMKKGIPVLIGERDSEYEQVFVERAKRLSDPIFFASDMFRIKGKQINKNGKLKLECRINSDKPFLCDLSGTYQLKNIGTVYAACSLLNSIGAFEITKKNFTSALLDVSESTGLRGRWEVLSKSPLVITDTGHNEAGIREVLDNIKNTKHKQLHFVIGVVNDKDVRKILSMLPKKASYYFTKASIPRALNEKELKNLASEFGLEGKTYSRVPLAIKVAKTNAGKQDLIFIGGSTFTVADAL